jgi:hypothetical protein
MEIACPQRAVVSRNSILRNNRKREIHELEELGSEHFVAGKFRSGDSHDVLG